MRRRVSRIGEIDHRFSSTGFSSRPMEIFTEKRTRDLRVAGSFVVRGRGASLPGCCSLQVSGRNFLRNELRCARPRGIGRSPVPRPRRGPARFVANAPGCRALIRSAALEGVFASSLDVRCTRTSALALLPGKAPLTPPPAAAARGRPRKRGGRDRLRSLRRDLRDGDPEGAMGEGALTRRWFLR